jgi:hypothetical protein
LLNFPLDALRWKMGDLEGGRERISTNQNILQQQQQQKHHKRRLPPTKHFQHKRHRHRRLDHH